MIAARASPATAAATASSRMQSHVLPSSRLAVRSKAAELPPEYAAAMKDPKVAAQMKAMQEAMSRPEMQQQMAEMQAYAQNQQVQQRMQELRNDPEFKQMFEEIQTGGMGALMKYMNDPRVLAKVGERLGDVQVPPPGAAAAAAAAGGAQAPPASAAAAAAANVPEIDNLFDAARHGDVEAVEDFIAIGKDVNAGDAEGRTPLHWACGFNHPEIATMLLDEGAAVEATDSKGNTALHYAAGYGRPALVEILLAAGANGAAKNESGKKPLDLAVADERNPLNQVPEVMEKLRAASLA